MCGIGAVVALGFVMLAWLSRREEGKILERMAMYLYKRGCICRAPFLNSRPVQTDLESLHPGQSGLLLQGEYYRQKIKMLLVVTGVGTLLGLAARLQASSGGWLTDAGELLRPEPGKGERRVELVASLEGGGQGRVSVTVPERTLTGEEVAGLYGEFWETLQQKALGDNPSWQQVASPLALVEELEGYPFTVSWTSSDHETVERDGTVHRTMEPSAVTLTAEISYLGYCRREQLEAIVTPPQPGSGEMLVMQAQEAYRAAEEQNVSGDRIPLPSLLGDRQLEWREVREDHSLLILLLTVVAAAAVFLFRDKDLHRQVLERREDMRGTYPMVLNKLTLYLGAGMTVRGAFQKIAADGRERRGGGNPRPLYEEMLYACNQLQAGIPESRAYELWAARTGLQDCARLSAMLVQNLKKGNAALLPRLKEEADKALQEDLNLRRKKGEEAGTKLLVPMVMMMAIVMALVMIPAFQGFGI